MWKQRSRVPSNFFPLSFENARCSYETTRKNIPRNNSVDLIFLAVANVRLPKSLTAAPSSLESRYFVTANGAQTFCLRVCACVSFFSTSNPDPVSGTCASEFHDASYPGSRAPLDDLRTMDLTTTWLGPTARPVYVIAARNYCGDVGLP